MHPLLFFILLSSLFLSSCSNKEELHIPDGVLSKEKMVKLMTRIYIIDGATDQQNFASGITMPADPKVSYARFLPVDSLSYDDFKKSYDFYLSHPAELTDIYDEVLNEISRLEAVHTKK